jgi:pilus assembly protein CpaB
MKFRVNSNWLLLGLALLLGGGAAYLGNQVLKQRMAQIDEEARRTREPVAVVVAKQDLAPGDAIVGESFAVRQVPREFVNADAIRPDGFAALENQRLAVAMKRGDMLLPVHADGQGAQVFSATLKPGRRAMTFEVDNVNSISGMLRPGDRIDLVYSGRGASASSGTEEEVTRTLQSNVLVLATDQSIMRRDEKTGEVRSFTAVTLDLLPVEAQRLIVAKQSGKLTALLRHPDDKAANATASLSPGSLFTGSARGGSGAVSTEYLIGGGGGGPAAVQTQLARLGSQLMPAAAAPAAP